MANVVSKFSESSSGPASQDAQDARLVRMVLSGDVKAFEGLLLRHQMTANTVARRLLNNQADADEVVQDAVLKAYRNLSELDKPERFGPWLMRIVCNLSLNRRRGRALRKASSLSEPNEREEAMASALADGKADRPESIASGRELDQMIARAIDELPELQRQAIVLFAISGMNQKDVAEVMETSIEAVKWHVFTARKKLRERLKDYLEE